MKHQYDIVAIIYARGGSKRLLRKNVLSFCGVPLVEWSIIQAICSHNIKKPEDVYLTTDDDEIAAIGEKHNISIICRPDWPNPDEISGAKVMIHAINKIRETRNYDLNVDIMPTSPMRFPDDIDQAINRYIELKKDHPDCYGVSGFIPQQEIDIMKKLNDNQMMKYLWNKDGYFGTPGIWATPWEPDFYIDSCKHEANIGFERSAAWLEPGKSGRPFYYIDGAWFQRFDIDNRDDFELCEFLMERYVLKDRGSQIYWDYKDSQR